MSDSDVTRDLRRAELARGLLARDLSTVVQTGNRLIERGKSLVRKTVPIALGMTLLGLMFAASIGARRRRLSVTPARRPSFAGELLRRVVMAAGATLASRLARRLPLPRLSEAKASSEPPASDFDPMVQELKVGRGPGRHRARA